MRKVRSLARQAIDIALPSGARIITLREEEALAARYKKIARSLYDICIEQYFPDLREREGRFELICQLIGTEVPEGVSLLHYLQQSLDGGPGDVVEMGIAQGATSALLANEILGTDRHLWLYDSFEGLSRPTAEDRLIDDIDGRGSMAAYAFTMAHPMERVQQRLRQVGLPADRTHIVRGFIRDDVPERQLPKLVAFAYLDCDLYEPIAIGLQLLASRTRPGSILMVDDFGYFSSGPEKAVREFLDKHANFEMLSRPKHAGHFCSLRATE